MKKSGKIGKKKKMEWLRDERKVRKNAQITIMAVKFSKVLIMKAGKKCDEGNGRCLGS